MRQYRPEASHDAMKKPAPRKKDSLHGPKAPNLFSELLVLSTHQDGCHEWIERSRWLRFREDVVSAASAWSTPHVSTPSLRGWMQLRRDLRRGTVMLDLRAADMAHICAAVSDRLVRDGGASHEEAVALAGLWQCKHRHHFEGARKVRTSVSGLALELIAKTFFRRQKISSSHHSAKGPEQLKNMDFTAIPIRDQNENNANKVGRINLDLQKKLYPFTEAVILLEASVSFLERPVSVFVRLDEPITLPDLPEVDVPTRFLYFKATGNNHDSVDTCEALATALTDPVFAEAVYCCDTADDVIDALDAYTCELKLLPSDYDTEKNIIKAETTIKVLPKRANTEEEEEELNRRNLEQSGLLRTGKLFGGLIKDVKRKAPFYLSDFRDCLHSRCISAVLFLYFASLSRIIAFGGVLGEATEAKIATMEGLLSGVISGLLFGFFSGQPLLLLGSTASVIISEKVLYSLCSDYGWDFLSLRLWTGIWMGCILVLLVAFDACSVIRYVTRFTQEIFATLIGVVCVSNALRNVWKISSKLEMEVIVEDEDNSSSYIHNMTVFNSTRAVDCNVSEQLSIFLECLLLFSGTFFISWSLKAFRDSAYLPNSVRTVLSDYAVVIAILCMTTVDYVAELPTPKLVFPESFVPTWEGRDWVVAHARTVPDHILRNPWWVDVFLAPVLAIPSTILIFLSQNITAVIVNRRERKLKKAGGCNLDLMVLATLVIICSVFGLPWYVATPVLSISHLQSLTEESSVVAPGEKRRAVGVREQRVTAIAIAALTGLTFLMTPALSLVPMPVLFGVFLFMGMFSLRGLQFSDRVLLLLVARKRLPDLGYLRSIPLWRVHLFTIIQLVTFILLWIVKENKSTSALFPLFLLCVCGIRKLMECVFTQKELRLLDDLLPETCLGRGRTAARSRPSMRRQVSFADTSDAAKRTVNEELDHLARQPLRPLAGEPRAVFVKMRQHEAFRRLVVYETSVSELMARMAEVLRAVDEAEVSQVHWRDRNGLAFVLDDVVLKDVLERANIFEVDLDEDANEEGKKTLTFSEVAVKDCED